MKKLKLAFNGAENLMEGLELIAGEINIEIVGQEDADVVVTVSEDATEAKTEAENATYAVYGFVEVEYKDKEAKISYAGGKARFFRGLGLLCEALNEGKAKFHKMEIPKFETNGAMFDMSRNSVFRSDTIKAIMRKMALMGLNTFMLYTEDTYEIKEEPYFGHMRGRYTHEEIKDLDAYAIKLGIELVPCIQLLAHLAMALKWSAMAKYRDTHDIIMVNSEETYKLIDIIMKNISDAFTSRKLHIGMDEAEFLGHGRYLSKHEYEDQNTLFIKHIKRIVEIAKPYGFELMMWSDMFFRMAGGNYRNPDIEFSDEILKNVPRGVQQVYWDYSSIDENYFKSVITKHYELTDKVIFAGGIHTWIGPAPAYSVTIKSSRAALTTCIENNVDGVLATVWHNGAEASLITSLFGIQLYAETDYTGIFDEEAAKARFKFICGIEADDLIAMEKADHPDGRTYEEAGVCNASRYFLYNDPLLGLVDKHAEGVDTRGYYKKLKEEFRNRGTESGLFAEAFRLFNAVIDVLELKADFGVRLKSAYEAANTAELHTLYLETYEISNRLENLRKVHRKSWMYYNKPFGFEMFDLIYGALIARFETVRYHLDNYFNDNSYRIEELDEPRLWFEKRQPGANPICRISSRFGRLFTAGVYCTVFNDIMIG